MARQPQTGKKHKTDADHMEHGRQGGEDAIYDLSDEALKDVLRECSAERAAVVTDGAEPYR
jgi:hypothetical protein